MVIDARGADQLARAPSRSPRSIVSFCWLKS